MEGGGGGSAGRAGVGCADALGVPFRRIGMTSTADRLEVIAGIGNDPSNPPLARWSVNVKQLRLAWQKGGYWE